MASGFQTVMENNIHVTLSNQKCVPCEGGMPPLTIGEYTPYMEKLPEWSVVSGIKIEKIFKFNTFKEAMVFVNTVADIAEANNHHPDINLFNWNKVKITLTTHAIGGLSMNDLILAAKLDEIKR